MSGKIGQVVALLLGISLTVGFYEGRRLVVNTSRAWTVASSQLAGTSPAAAQKREAIYGAIAEKGGEEAVAKAREERVQAIARRAEQRGSPVDRARAERLAARLDAWEDLTPEQRDAVKERRQARLQQARHAAGRAGAAGPGGAAHERPPRPGQGGASAEGGGSPAEEGFSAEDEALLDDTALLLEELEALEAGEDAR